MNANLTSTSQATLTLDQMPNGAVCYVKHVSALTVMPEWKQQLEDLGFFAGEQAQILTRGALGGDPLVVRIGLSTFALRKAEAACIQVQMKPSSFYQPIANQNIQVDQVAA